MKLNVICNTGGNGFWSTSRRAVRLTEMRLDIPEPFFDDDKPNAFGELQVYFDRRCWNLPRHGLIYTDSQWIKEFRQNLVSMGFSKVSTNNMELDYSEQGMQGDDYVSLDVGSKFIKAWKKQEATI